MLESTGEPTRSVVARDRRTCGTLPIWQNHVPVTVPCDRSLCCLLCFGPESAVPSTLCTRTRVDTRTCHRPVFSSSSATLQVRPSRPVSLEHDAQPRYCPPTSSPDSWQAVQADALEADSLTTGPRARTTEMLHSTSPLCHPFIESSFRPPGHCSTQENRILL